MVDDILRAELAETRQQLAVVTQQLDAVTADHGALQDSERRYRQLVELSPVPMLVHVDRKIAYANLAGARVIGLADPEQLIGHSILEFATPATRSKIAAREASVVKYGNPLAADLQSFVRVNDGREIHVEVTSVQIVYQGRPAILSIARDITRGVEAEHEMATTLREADLGRRKLEVILAALPVGVCIADADGRLTHTNRALDELWGGVAPLVNDSSKYGTYKGRWPATGATLRADEWALARTLQTGETIKAEPIDIERFDGSRGHVLNSTAPILDDRGAVIGGIAVLLDVTGAQAAARERERLIASLEFERRRLGTLLEKAPAFIAVVRGTHHILELVNEAFYALVGPREAIGKAMIDAVPELGEQRMIEGLDHVRDTGALFVANGMPVQLVRRPGQPAEQRYVNVLYQPLVEADGTRTGVFIHGIDVTDEAIAQHRTRTQFNNIPIPTEVWQRVERDGAPQFVLVDFNAAGLALSRGLLPTHLGESAAEYFASAPSMGEDLDRCLDRGEVIQCELDRELRGTVETRRLLVTFAPAPPDLVIVHAEDVTDRRKLEDQLRQSLKMEAVGRLAAGVAHDFNNILSVILSYTEMYLDELKPEDPFRVDLGEIYKASMRAVGLTRQLLAFSRQQILQPRVIDLGETVRGLDSMLRRVLGEDIELTLLTADQLHGLYADPGQIEQVIMNLVVNARDAMPTGGTLTIETTNVVLDEDFVASHVDAKPGHYLLLAVSDTGMGMDAATRAKIFEPFFTTKGPTKGTGLGLSTVFGIVHQSGGTIWVDSEPGRGATFQIYLPRATRGAETGAIPTVAALLVGGSETILLVEDDEAVRVVSRTMLRRAGYHVLEAQNAGEAFLVCEEFPTPIHLLLTDVVMPRMNGRQLAERLQVARKHMKVLYMSGYTDDAVVLHDILEAGVAFIHKPITSETLLRKVRGVLDSVDGARARTSTLQPR